MTRYHVACLFATLAPSFLYCPSIEKLLNSKVLDLDSHISIEQDDDDKKKVSIKLSGKNLPDSDKINSLRGFGKIITYIEENLKSRINSPRSRMQPFQWGCCRIYLDLSHNKLTSLNDADFLKFTNGSYNVVMIDLRSNNLKSIPENFLVSANGTIPVEDLNLSHNKNLAKLPPQFLAHASHLRHFSARQTRIKQYPSSITAGKNQILKFDISDRISQDSSRKENPETSSQSSDELPVIGETLQ